jgi:hypothetical protein
MYMVVIPTKFRNLIRLLARSTIYSISSLVMDIPLFELRSLVPDRVVPLACPATVVPFITQLAIDKLFTSPKFIVNHLFSL